MRGFSTFQRTAQDALGRNLTHNADETINEKFYYVHDRLGSVRLMVDYDDATDTVGAVCIGSA